MYANGTGVEKDLVEAVKWYRKAAEKGNVNGQFNFAVCYEQGWGVEKDLAEAAKWYRKAAEKGNPGAQKRLAGMFEHGDGVAKDLAEAGKWYRKAAEGYLKTLEASRAAAAQGDTQALNEFAWTFATSESAEVRDGRAAVGLAEKAATATGHKDPMLLDTLAAAYAEVGQFTNAARVQKEGIALLEDRKSKEDYGSRLKLYESNSPYHTVNQSLAPAAESPIQIAALLHARGRLRAQYGQWQEAIPDFTKAIQLNPDDDLIWYLLAPLLLEAGDVEGYRKHRQAFLARFCTTNDPPTAQRIAKGAMLLPLAGPDLAAASNLAEIAVTAGKNDSRVAFSQFVKGLAEYREGHFAHAAEWAKKALSKLGEDSQRDVQAYAVLAMARHKLGQTNEAHAVLANANQVNETKLPKLDSGDLGAAWNNVLIARILLREADTLIGGGGSAGAKP
jgi:tetratricopeptide (TPR) repeat protein